MRDGTRTVLVILASLFTAGAVAAGVTGWKFKAPHDGIVKLAAGALPTWNIADICASDSAAGQCRVLEGEAQRTLLGGWSAVPEAYRTACMTAIKSPLDHSYRLLSQCLEAQVLEGRKIQRSDADTGRQPVRAAQAAAATAAQTATSQVTINQAAAGPAAAAGASGYAVLPTSAVADLFKAREAWGTSTAKDVAAPLAAGAVSPLPTTNFSLPKGFEGQPTVHALQATPVAQLTAVPQDQITDAMKKLLAQREGWLKGAPADGGYAVLPTTDVADLFKAREAWGMGKAKDVAAPLATGAFSPLPSTSFPVPKGFEGQPTVHALQATPVAQLTAIPQEQIAGAMQKLLAERAGWGTAPGEVPTGGAAGYAVLPTTNVADLFKARETWGMSKAKDVAAPLAAGAVSPLPSTNFVLPKGFEGQPTVHALQSTPVAQLTPVPQDVIADAMKKLLAEREGWGKAPGEVPAGGGAGYAVLPTTNVADLFKARETWGMSKAKDVAAPLAAGAVSPLPSTNFVLPKGFEGQPTVHALQSTPVAQLTPVPQDVIADAMKKLLAEREGWLSAPAKVTAAPVAAAPTAGAQAPGNAGYAVLPTTNVADLFKAREAWGISTAKQVAAPLATGAVSPLPSTSFTLPKGFEGQPTVHALQASPVAQLTPVAQDQISDAMKKLLAEREGWGTAPGKAAAPAVPAAASPAAAAPAAPAAAPKSAEAADCEAKLKDVASKGVILFKSGSARIDAKSNATLDALANIAKGCTKGSIRIEGHTDSSGNAASNKALSEQRAKAVADYLTKKGLVKDRVAAFGFGPDKPVADNATPEGRAQNRRIEFNVVD